MRVHVFEEPEKRFWENDRNQEQRTGNQEPGNQEPGNPKSFQSETCFLNSGLFITSFIFCSMDLLRGSCSKGSEKARIAIKIPFAGCGMASENLEFAMFELVWHVPSASSTCLNQIYARTSMNTGLAKFVFIFVLLKYNFYACAYARFYLIVERNPIINMSQPNQWWERDRTFSYPSPRKKLPFFWGYRYYWFFLKILAVRKILKWRISWKGW
jgi:hypothetical protein